MKYKCFDMLTQRGMSLIMLSLYHAFLKFKYEVGKNGYRCITYNQFYSDMYFYMKITYLDLKEGYPIHLHNIFYMNLAVTGAKHWIKLSLYYNNIYNGATYDINTIKKKQIDEYINASLLKRHLSKKQIAHYYLATYHKQVAKFAYIPVFRNVNYDTIKQLDSIENVLSKQCDVID